jgi:hypothetical protein
VGSGGQERRRAAEEAGDYICTGDQDSRRDEGGQGKGKLKQEADQEDLLEEGRGEGAVREHALQVLLHDEYGGRKGREEADRRGSTAGRPPHGHDARYETDEDESERKRDEEVRLEPGVPRFGKELFPVLVVR